MSSILDSKLGSQMQRGKIVDIEQTEAVDKDGTALQKVILLVDLPNKKKLRIDEAWVLDRKLELKAHGLWLKHDADGNINRMSTVGKLMLYYNAATLRELVGREVLLHPKKNEFMAVVATKDFNEDDI